MKLSPVELRHTLHRNPEISFLEFRTSELLVNTIKDSIDNTHLKIHRPFKTGLLVDYKINEGDYLLFRADIDALPINEENEIDFKSENNYMHACGHDVHTSILYSFLNYVTENNIDQNILFLFQPAEESGGGAMEFYKTGVFESFKIRNAFALHVTDEYKEGTIASTPGVLFASALEVDFEFKGLSAHVAFPKEGNNAFNALRIFLDECDKLPKVEDSPVVFGIGKIYSGEVRNITPGFAKLETSIRSLSEEKVLNFCTTLETILETVKSKTGVDYKMKKGAHYPEVIVDKILFKKLSAKLSKKYEFIDCGHKMTGEDFGFFSKKFASFMFWLGTSKSGERFGLHNPRFLPPDSVIEKGKNIFTTILELFI
ncbi:MAG TPA: amidohydrolase [Ignavibacteriaceae bacterium]|nr:amidohydrolase [Ignavibacteriaceae bacterium]